MVETLRKLIWAFEFWNEMLVSNIRCKNLLKSSSVGKLLLEFWEERGEKLMTCHLFLDNFLKFHDLWVVSKVKSFEMDFCFKKTQVSQLWCHEMFVFSESCLSQKTCYYRNLIVFSCLQFADCYMWPRIVFVLGRDFCV